MRAWLAVWLGLLAGSARAHIPPPPAPGDQVHVEVNRGVAELSWADYEDRVKGNLSTGTPREGEPLQVHVHVGSFEGAEFDGPVTLTLREAKASFGQTQTVRRGEANWSAEFVPETSGPYQLDITFRTTHVKVVHAKFDVAARPVPRAVKWSLVILAGLAAIGFGARSLIQRERLMPPSPEPDVPPAEASATEASPAGASPSEASPSEASPSAPPAPAAAEPAPVATGESAPAPESEKASGA